MDTTPSGEQAATLSERVAEEIRAMLGRKHMSQAELARKLGQGPMWVSERLRGVQTIDLMDLERIADALEVSPLELIPKSPPPLPAPSRRPLTADDPNPHPVNPQRPRPP